MFKHYIGIDPGVSGAIAVLSDKGGECKIFDIPTVKVTMTTKTKNGNLRKKNAIAFRDLYDLFNEQVKNPNETFAIIEKVNSYGMGSQSAFNFGQVFGALEMILVSCGVSYDLVAPNRWKKEIGLKKAADKKESRMKAQMLFPSMKEELKREKDHNRAEALLLAEYARRMRGM